MNRQRNSKNTNMSASHEEYQQQQRPLRRSRPQHMNAMAEDGPSMESIPVGCQPQHHGIDLPETEKPNKGAAHNIFDIIYQVIFSLVHLALSVVLTPVLGKVPKKQPSSSCSRTSSAAVAVESLQSLASLPPVPVMDDPECGMSVSSGSSTSCSSGSSSSESSISGSSILRSNHRRSTTSESSSSEKKSVRFPPPERSRPPLGRIGLSSSSSVGSVASSSSRSSCSSSKLRRDRSVTQATSRGNSGRRTPSPPLGRLATPRMKHSSYFLE